MDETLQRFDPEAERPGKHAILRQAHRAGLFDVARRLTRSSLRILCYHGFTVHDESAFRPGLFIDRETLRERMRALAEGGYVVLRLDEAIGRLRDGSLPPGATVITIDDGFASTHTIAQPVFEEFGFVATVYVTSYHVLKRSPVFGLVVDYLFFESPLDSVEFRGRAWLASRTVHPRDARERARAVAEIIAFGEHRCSDPERTAILGELAADLGVDLRPIVDGRLLSLMTSAEVATMAGAGFDVQLHTHRHVLPPDDQRRVVAEIEENRRYLTEWTGVRPDHLCYPSGQFVEAQWPWLDRLGIASATTCAPGLVTRATPLFGCGRFLDGEDVSQLEFDAEMSGFLELMRRGRSLPHLDWPVAERLGVRLVGTP